MDYRDWEMEELEFEESNQALAVALTKAKTGNWSNVLIWCVEEYDDRGEVVKGHLNQWGRIQTDPYDFVTNE